MKKVILTFVYSILIATSFAQNLFTYGKHAVTKDEFLRAYNKNPTTTPDRKKALREYLLLYINFKLKVQEALAEGLDKDPTQQYELQNFKRQTADNIINEKANLKELVKEAFERSLKEIHLAQIFIEVLPNNDTTIAYNQIQKAYKALQEGKDFGTAAQEFSGDEATRQTKGELGYISAFTLPYEFENIAYSLKPNTYSSPVKTKLGYHIFKNVGERKSQGYRRVAQILVALPPGGTASERAAAANKADSIYNLLKQGQSFDSLVSTTSNDLTSSNNKGELPEFTTGSYSPEFEAVAFSLTKPGEFSKPFSTSFGFHILKLLEVKPVLADITNPVTFATLQDKVVKDNRMDLSKKQLINKQLVRFNYKPGLVKEKELFSYTDSVIHKPNIPAIGGMNESTIIFSFTKQNVTAGDWIRFARAAPQQISSSKLDYTNLYKDFIGTSAEEYYRNNLESYNMDYAKQVREFKEANLLFAVMEKNIWGKANTDTAELVNYYKAHQSKYKWSASADAIVITCRNKQITDDIQQKLNENFKNWRQITVSKGDSVSADSGRYELGQLATVDRTNFTSGLLTAPVHNETDGTYTFNYIVRVYPNGDQKSFDDARGMVINDYQLSLENIWITKLKKKYPVKINEAVFNTIK